MSTAILAAYLLGFDEAYEENQRLIKSRSNSTNKISKKEQTVNFASNDDRADKVGPVDLRFDVPPSEAIDYFQRKRIVTKKTFDKLEREAKAASFYVSDIYREDLLKAFKFEITDALESGQTQKFVTKQFKDILDGAGHPELGDWHLESIVRSNMMTAYGVGHRKALEESADDLPFWEYSAVGDDRTRPTHRALDGIIYPANDPFWDEHFPPWGFNCRCSVIARISMPDDYDHSRPNKDTKIAFDQDGLPAKAEYLTQVVDLKATNFVGVPKKTNLETALTDAAKAAKDGRLLNHTGVPQTVVDKAREIRKSNVENSIAWNADGEFLGHFKGDKDSVNIPPAVATQMKQGFDLHNHPPEKGRYFEAPSDLDFIESVNTDLKAFYVVTRNYLYQVRQPKGGWKPNSIAEFDTIYDEVRAKIAIDLLKKYRTETLTKEQISDIENHLIWKAVAKKMNFKYKRFELSEL